MGICLGIKKPLPAGGTHGSMIVSKQKEGAKMGQTDKQFNGFLRVVIRDLKAALAAKDLETTRELLQELLTDLQNTLED